MKPDPVIEKQLILCATERKEFTQALSRPELLTTYFSGRNKEAEKLHYANSFFMAFFIKTPDEQTHDFLLQAKQNLSSEQYRHLLIESYLDLGGSRLRLLELIHKKHEKNPGCLDKTIGLLVEETHSSFWIQMARFMPLHAFINIFIPQYAEKIPLRTIMPEFVFSMFSPPKIDHYDALIHKPHLTECFVENVYSRIFRKEDPFFDFYHIDWNSPDMNDFFDQLSERHSIWKLGKNKFLSMAQDYAERQYPNLYPAMEKQALDVAPSSEASPKNLKL